MIRKIKQVYRHGACEPDIVERGVHAADETFPGNPSGRLGFNWGVKWLLEEMTEASDDRLVSPTESRTTPR